MTSGMAVPEICVWLQFFFDNRIYFGFISKARWHITPQRLGIPLTSAGNPITIDCEKVNEVWQLWKHKSLKHCATCSPCT